MNDEAKLKLQAWVDGELTAKEAAEVSAWVANDNAAKSLADDLRMAKTVLAANEPEYAVPASREFYWSAIERQISREEVKPAAVASGWVLQWRRWLAPAAGLAAVACMLVLADWRHGSDQGLADVEVPLEDMGAMTYRDQSTGMTVIWLYDRPDKEVFTEPQSIDNVEIK